MWGSHFWHCHDFSPGDGQKQSHAKSMGRPRWSMVGPRHGVGSLEYHLLWPWYVFLIYIFSFVCYCFFDECCINMPDMVYETFMKGSIIIFLEDTLHGIVWDPRRVTCYVIKRSSYDESSYGQVDSVEAATISRCVDTSMEVPRDYQPLGIQLAWAWEGKDPVDWITIPYVYVNIYTLYTHWFPCFIFLPWFRLLTPVNRG